MRSERWMDGDNEEFYVEGAGADERQKSGGCDGMGQRALPEVHYADQRLRTTGVFSFKLWLC